MSPLNLSLSLALITCCALLPLACLLALWICHTPRSLLASIIESLCTLPLVLPPTVLGFYLLIFLGPYGPLAPITLALWGDTLAFTFTGLIFGSMIYSLPFALQPILKALKQLGTEPLELSRALGTPKYYSYWFVLLPSIHRSILSAFGLCFAHTLGEFGVVLMIGGNISGSTRLASLAIYDLVEQMNYDQAHRYAAWMLMISVTCLALIKSFGENKGSTQ